MNRTQKRPPRKIRSFPGTLQDPARLILLREEAAITWVVDILLEKHHTRLGKHKVLGKYNQYEMLQRARPLSQYFICIISFNSLEQSYKVSILCPFYR